MTAKGRPKLTPAQRQAMLDLRPLALEVADRHGDRWPHHRDDLRSEATLALAWAIQGHDPDRPRAIGLEGYVRRRVSGACLDYLRRLLPAGRRRSRDVPPTFVLNPVDEEVCSRLRYEDPGLAAVDDRDAVEAMLRKAPRRMAEAIRAVVVEGRTRAEHAAAVGRTEACISLRIKRGLGYIREALADRAAA